MCIRPYNHLPISCDLGDDKLPGTAVVGDGGRADGGAKDL